MNNNYESNNNNLNFQQQQTALATAAPATATATIATAITAAHHQLKQQTQRRQAQPQPQQERNRKALSDNKDDDDESGGFFLSFSPFFPFFSFWLFFKKQTFYFVLPPTYAYSRDGVMHYAQHLSKPTRVLPWCVAFFNMLRWVETSCQPLRQAAAAVRADPHVPLKLCRFRYRHDVLGL